MQAYMSHACVAECQRYSSAIFSDFIQRHSGKQQRLSRPRRPPWYSPQTILIFLLTADSWTSKQNVGRSMKRIFGLSDNIERSFGKVQRSVAIPFRTKNVDSANAKFENGVLSASFGKLAGGAGGIKLQIT